jgi:hypothetical protein
METGMTYTYKDLVRDMRAGVHPIQRMRPKQEEKPRIASSGTGRDWEVTCAHGTFTTDSWDDAVHWALGCNGRGERG